MAMLCCGKNNVISTGSRIYNKNRVLIDSNQLARMLWIIKKRGVLLFLGLWGSKRTLDVNTFRRTITNRVRHVSESIFQFIWFHNIRACLPAYGDVGFAPIFGLSWFFFFFWTKSGEPIAGHIDFCRVWCNTVLQSNCQHIVAPDGFPFSDRVGQSLSPREWHYSFLLYRETSIGLAKA